MARPKQPPRIVKWRGKYYLKFFDWERGTPRRLSCEELGAVTKAQRDELVKQQKQSEVQARAAYVKSGGPSAYATKLIDGLRMYLKRVDERTSVRDQNPESREGLSADSQTLAHRAVEKFEQWIIAKGRKNLTTGKLDAPTLQSFVDFLVTEDVARGKRKIKRSMATVNKYRRDLKTCIGYLGTIRPQMFPDVVMLVKALKPKKEIRKPAMAFSPSQLSKFLDVAIERETPGRVVEVVRVKSGTDGKKTHHKQAVNTDAGTPVSRLFLLLALTGCRRSEALRLTWDAVDLKKGRISFFSTKTGMPRILPLVSASEGEVAPQFLLLLRHWKASAGDCLSVLPFQSSKRPVFPQTAWSNAAEQAGIKAILPQTLRQNFTSYAASVGVPASVCAMWQGHGAGVAEMYYRAQVLDRHEGASIEEAMGLSTVIKNVLAETNSSGSGAVLHHRRKA